MNRHLGYFGLLLLGAATIYGVMGLREKGGATAGPGQASAPVDRPIRPVGADGSSVKPDIRRFNSGIYDQTIDMILAGPGWATVDSVVAEDRRGVLREMVRRGEYESAAAYSVALADTQEKNAAMGAVMLEWAKADYRSSLDWLAKSGALTEDSAAEGYFAGVAANKDPAVVDAVGQAIKVAPSDSIATMLLNGAAKVWISTGRISSEELVGWWDQAAPKLKNVPYDEITSALALSAYSTELFAKDGKLSPSDVSHRVEDGLLGARALYALLQARTADSPDSGGADGLPDTGRLSTFIGKLGEISFAGEHPRDSLAAYGRTGISDLDPAFLSGVGISLGNENPTVVARVIRADPTSREAASFWDAYVGTKTQLPVASALGAFADPSIPEPLLARTASLLVPGRLAEDSMATTQAINGMPEGPAKKLYRKEVEKWLLEKGQADEAKAWASGK